MNELLADLKTAVENNPFDESLRAKYAQELISSGLQEKGIEQYKLLAQQFAANPFYQKQIDELIANEGEEKNNNKRFAGLSVIEGSEMRREQHNVVNLSSNNKVRFVDIAGMQEIKKIIRRRIIDPFVNPGLFQKFRRKAGGGVLLYGPPGCGKTMIARAIATECNASFHSIGISDILNMFIGQSEANLANIFMQARNNAPAVLFFDELDALAYSRSKANSDHTRTLVNEFLSQLDGLTGENDKVLILGATNMPWDVDDAMKRPGRFDRQFFVPPPDQQAVAEMLAVKLREVPCDAIDFMQIARQCKQFSGADIDGLIEVSKDLVLDDIMESGQERKINQNDLQAAIGEVTPTTIEWLQTAVNLVKYANAAGSYKDVAKYLKAHGVY